MGEEAVSKIADMEASAYSCLLTGKEAAKKEWEQKSRKFEDYLAKQKTRDIIEEIALDNLRANQA